MNRFLIVGVLMAGLSAGATLAHPLSESVVGALGLFPADFATVTGRSYVDEIYGFEATVAGDDVEVVVSYIPTEGALASLVYDCHEHAPGHRDCHAAEDRPSISFLSRPRHFSLQDLHLGMNEALALYSRRVAPLADLESIKIWQSGRDVQVILRGSKDGQRVESFMGCHWHTVGHFDCHRQRVIGRGEQP